MLAFGVAAALLSVPSAQEVPRLEVGKLIESRIEAGDPIVATEQLIRNFGDAPVLGRSCSVEVAEPGSYTLELRSYFFDSYLVLRDSSGRVLAEDDDGLIGTHSRIVFEANAETKSFRVDACALHGGRGLWSLKLLRGKPEVLSARDRGRAGLEDARAGLRIVEADKGPDHPDTATSIDNLAALLQDVEGYTEARALFARSLAIRERAFGPAHRETAASLDRLGWLLRATGSFTEARPVFERALEIREKVLGPEHPGTATSLDHLAMVLQALGNYGEARPIFERALEIREKVLGPEHLQTAWSLNNLGWHFQEVGSYAEALGFYERALAVQEKVLGPEHLDTARSLNNLGSVLQAMARYTQARPLYERAFAIREKVLGPEHSDTAASLSSLAALLQAMGRYREARPLYERALAIYEKALGPEHPSTAAGLGSLAWLLKEMGCYSEARPLYERDLAIRERVLGPEHPRTAIALNNLAILLEVMGSAAEARPLLERSLAIDEKVLGPDHPDTAIGFNNLAMLLYGMGRYAEARPLLERALAIRERVLGHEHPGLAVSLNNLALLLKVMGRYAEARPLLERALAIDENTLGPDHPDTGTRLESLASLLQVLGSCSQARPLYERALAIRERALGSGHPCTTQTLGHLAILQADLGQEQPAWLLATSAFERTIRNLRSTFPVLSEAERVNLCSNAFDSMQSSLTLEPRSPDPGTRRTTYGSVLTWKGQVTRTSLDDRERTLRSLSPEKQAEVQELRGVQAQISAEISRAAAAEHETREKRLAELRDRRSLLERDLLGTSGSLGQAEPSPADLIAKLPMDSALVDFIEHENYVPAVIENGTTRAVGRWTDPHVTAWIVRGGSESIDRIDLGEAKPIREAIGTLLSVLQGERGVGLGPGSGVGPAQKANDRVRELLWKPIVSKLGSASRIFVSPDRFLGTFPFETLMDEDGRYLVEKLAISYVSDGATLASILESRPGVANAQDDSLLDIGGLDYDARGMIRIERAQDDSNAAHSVRGNFQDYWEPLRFTRKEAETVFALHESEQERRAGESARSGDGASSSVPAIAPARAAGSQLILGSDAVEEVLKRKVSGKRYIHIATHGFFQPEGLPSMWENARENSEKGGPAMSGETERITGLLPGLLSGLVCAGANLPAENGRDDGLLTAEEVTWLDLTHCELLVLSACQTALGKDRAGEGMMSLQRAFQMAGAKSVISSLWNVDDERTVELMRSFYKHLWLDGQSRIDSLRHAQLEMLAKNRAEGRGLGLPWTWGAFLLYGDWR